MRSSGEAVPCTRGPLSYFRISPGLPRPNGEGEGAGGPSRGARSPAEKSEELLYRHSCCSNQGSQCPGRELLVLRDREIGPGTVPIPLHPARSKALAASLP